MKITFVRTAQDRYTQNERYTAGDEADIRTDLARVLIERGDAVAGWGIEYIIADDVGSEQPAPTSAAVNAPDYASMKVTELRDLAARLDIDGYSTMRKAELVEALESAA